MFRKLFSSSEFDNVTLRILEKECLIDRRSIFLFLEEFRNDRDSDLKQIENAFKDPEDGFWEKNSSEDIVGNSEVG